MTNEIKTLIALGLIAFTWVNAQLAESVGTYQLNASYACNYTAVECRGDWPNRIVTSR